MDDGNEVIAKIPCSNAGPRFLTTASEVATLKFLQSRTSIRVPKVLAWSADAANPVGAEYIIMEKIPGVHLVEKWPTLNALQRYKIIGQVVQLEKELANIVLPAYGCLYLRESLPAVIRQHPLPSDLDPNELFCIGPSCKRTWWDGDSVDMAHSLSIDVGPWTNLSEYALSTVQREVSHIARFELEVQRELHAYNDSQTTAEYQTLLDKNRVMKVSKPVLWHTDLHFGNIFVSPTNPTVIEGIIDWQSIQSAPLTIQARFPEFLRPPKNYKVGPELPVLPDGFDDLSPEEQEQATEENELARQAKCYEMSCLRCSKHPAQLTRGLFPIRECLIQLSDGWSTLDLPDNCPFEMTEREQQKHAEQQPQYQDTLMLWDIATRALLTDESGWVPHDRWEATVKVNLEIYAMYIETMSEEMTPDEAARSWPFPPMEA
ncbi:hypothetical protein BJX70DRAFT_390279 [Aspergillus crustosus]